MIKLNKIFEAGNEPDDFRVYFENNDVTNIAYQCDVPEKPLIVGKGKIDIIVFTSIKNINTGKLAFGPIFDINSEPVTIQLVGNVHWSIGESGIKNRVDNKNDKPYDSPDNVLGQYINLLNTE